MFYDIVFPGIIPTRLWHSLYDEIRGTNIYKVDELKGTSSDVVNLITSEKRLQVILASALKQPRIAVDLESNGLYRYPERVCLVQLATADGIYLLDPLLLGSSTGLGELLADKKVEKIFHSADYDIRSLDRDWGFRIGNLFDTSIAAAFIGSSKLGLAAVLKEYLKIDIIKDKKLQRADWTVRPLSRKLIDYAADDVRYLDKLRTVLYERLGELGRIEWFKEESDRLARIKYSPPDPDWTFLSVKGSRTLDGKGLAVLRSLHGFREKEALRRDRPPFKIFSDAVLIELSGRPDSDISQLKGIGRYGYGPASVAVRRAIRDGLTIGYVGRPKIPVRNDRRPKPTERERARERLALLKKWRSQQGDRLKLDASLLWPAKSLARLSISPEGLEDEFAGYDVREWQRCELGESLQVLMEQLQ